MSARRLAACLAIVFAIHSGTARVADASPIQLSITIQSYSSGPPGPFASFYFNLFQNSNYVWPGFPGAPYLATGNGTLASGTTSVYYVTIPNADLSQLYFAGIGTYYLGQGTGGLFAALPPGGGVSDGAMYQYGAPGILLASLAPDNPLHGTLRTFYGYGGPGAVGGSWEIATRRGPCDGTCGTTPTQQTH